MAAYREMQGGGRSKKLKELARDIHATNLQNGFDPPNRDNLPAKIMFAVTELDEGMQAIAGTGDDPLVEELADTAIRILDVLHSLWDNDWVDRTVDVPEIRPEGGLWEPGQVALWRPLRMLCKAVESWRYGEWGDVKIALEIALRDLYMIGLRLGVDLHGLIAWKNDRNGTRGKWHGKARSDG
jgi:hypothetical protein